MLRQTRILIPALLALCAGCGSTSTPYSIGAQDSIALAQVAPGSAATEDLLAVDVRLLWPLRQTNFKLLDATNQSEAPDAPTLRALRRAESDYLSRTLADRLRDSGHWGTVRLNPYGITGADLEVNGRIIQSDGQVLRIQVDARDSHGTQWLSKQYVQTLPRIAGSGAASPPFPFTDLFNAIANDLAVARGTFVTGDATALRNDSLVNFAVALAPSDRAVERQAAALQEDTRSRLLELRARNDAFLDAIQLSYGAHIDRSAPHYLRFLAQTRLMTNFTNDRFQIGTTTPGDIDTGPLRGAQSVEMENMPRPTEDTLAPLALEFGDRTVTLAGTIEEQSRQWAEALLDMYERGERSPAD